MPPRRKNKNGESPMKPSEMRERTLDDIRNDLAAAEESLRNLRFQLVTSQLDKTSMIRQAKREIARLNTVIREHELGIHTLVAPGEKKELQAGGKLKEET
jgi:large subunit ribosomal protein L29